MLSEARDEDVRLSGRIWAYHPRSLPDELLSSWLVRIAHGHGEKVQTFCSLELGGRHEVWNRDVDRLAPRWLMHRLSIGTGIPLAEAYRTTLRSYRLHLYPRHHETGIQQWILPLDMWHRKYLGHGLQFCPACLAEDAVPYYRKRWRVALYTVCTRHDTTVYDCCPACGAGAAFHRIELGRYGNPDVGPLTFCHACGFDLRRAPLIVPIWYEDSSRQVMLGVLRMLEGGDGQRFDLGFFSVLHQICKLVMSNIKHVRLRKYVIEQTGAPDIQLQAGRKSFEERPLRERHHVIQLGMWLMADPGSRLVEAWRMNMVRYNVLKRDFNRMPQWYKEVVNVCFESKHHFDMDIRII